MNLLFARSYISGFRKERELSEQHDAKQPQNKRRIWENSCVYVENSKLKSMKMSSAETVGVSRSYVAKKKIFPASLKLKL